MTHRENSNRSRTALILGVIVGGALIGRKLLQRRREADLSGQVALITGGTSGLGYLIAREFAREGCTIVTCARHEDELRQVRDALTAEGADVLTLQCDVADRDQVDETIERATSHFGRIDILVNNAGVIQVGPANVMTQKDYENAMGIMFWGTVYPTLSVLPQMTSRRSGRIVNITSIGGKVSVPHLLPYNTAKFAAVGFSEGLRAELKKDGISVTTIVPGLMRTGSYFNAQFKGQEKKEFLWFSLGSSLPLITIDAERAARQVVQATKRGDAERILSIPANVLAKFHGLFPGATNEILGLVDRLFLPEADGHDEQPSQGRDVQERLDSAAQEAATTLGRTSAERFQPDQNLPEDTVSDPRD